jgi:hypothetical protein
MPIIQQVAKSLSRFVNIVSRLADDWEGPWFRGQDRASDSLTPRRYRHRFVDEDDIRAVFKRRLPQLLLGPKPESEWERYFLMQHYGVPTRLLDWSEGGLLALHFALISNHSRNDAAVWVFDPFWLNGAVAKLTNRQPDEVRRLAKLLPEADDRRDVDVLKTYLTELVFPQKRFRLPEFPLAIQPSHIDRRLAAQLSSFTIHGRDPVGLERVAEDDPHSRLAKITIPREAVKRMLMQLLEAGITEATAFPDLLGLCLELTRLDTGPPIPRSLSRRVHANPPRRIH